MAISGLWLELSLPWQVQVTGLVQTCLSVASSRIQDRDLSCSGQRIKNALDLLNRCGDWALPAVHSSSNDFAESSSLISAIPEATVGCLVSYRSKIATK